MRLSSETRARVLRMAVAPLATGALLVACGGSPHDAAATLSTGNSAGAVAPGSAASADPAAATASTGSSPSKHPRHASTLRHHRRRTTHSPSHPAPATRPAASRPSLRPTPTPAPRPTSKPTPKPAPAPLPATGMSTEEAQVLQLVNRERASAGCWPLTSNSILLGVARAHSKDMAVNGYFDHNSQDGRTPFDRMRVAGYRGNLMGENIAAGQPTPAAVMAAWMHSSGHRANILNCGFKVIGVGVYRLAGSPYRVYWTQDFGDR